MMPRAALPLLLALLAAAMAPAMDGVDGVPDIFDARLAKAPRPGDWLEYRIAFPVDPLENSLAAAPVKPPDAPALSGVDAMPDDAEYLFFKPSFDPPVAWRALPLRLEIRDITDSGCNAVLTFEGDSHLVLLPSRDDEAEAEFFYGAPQQPDRRQRVVLGGENLEVDVVRRVSGQYGFVRLFSPDIPFGIVRFATPDVDLILVAAGRGQPPDFPTRPTEPIQPPPGLLYGQTE